MYPAHDRATTFLLSDFGPNFGGNKRGRGGKRKEEEGEKGRREGEKERGERREKEREGEGERRREKEERGERKLEVARRKNNKTKIQEINGVWILMDNWEAERLLLFLLLLL